MGSTGMLHLRFDPPATKEQIKSFVARFQDLDWDAPGEDYFDEDGTIAGRFGGVVGPGRQAWAYWRKPTAYMGDVVSTLESVGLRGHGWSIETYDSEFNTAPDVADHFAFGGHPYAEQIQKDNQRREAVMTEFRLERAVIMAAKDVDLDVEDYLAAVSTAAQNLRDHIKGRKTESP
jgi:hypothetical protein